MAKIYGLFGAMTGKVADVVMVVRNGAQVARKYQPVVSNPSTLAQVAVRSRLKMLSQLAAVLSPVIAIPKEGIVSARNLFVKRNYGLSSFANNEASIDLNNVQLTRSSVGLPSLFARRDTASIVVSFGVTGSVPIDASRVVYSMFEKGDDNKLRFAGSIVATEAGADGGWSASLPSVTREVVIYGYAIRDNNDVARTAFGNIEAPSAQNIAQLIVSRTLTEYDITLSETKGFTLAAAN